MATITEILLARETATGLTRFFIDLALHCIEFPSDLPSLEGAPCIDRDYKLVSFEGIKCAGKDFHIALLLKKRTDLVLKEKFKKIFPFSFLNDLRRDRVFGGVADTLLLAAAYAYDKEYYVGKGEKCYLQNRGVYTFATMEVLRLSNETDFEKTILREFLLEIITLIGLPDLGFYFDVDLETAILRSKQRNVCKPSKEIIDGLFLEQQKSLRQEYEYLLKRQLLHRISSQDAEKNIKHIEGLIDALIS